MAPNNSQTDPQSPSLPSHSVFPVDPLVVAAAVQGAEPMVPVETVQVVTRNAVLAVQTVYDYPNRR